MDPGAVFSTSLSRQIQPKSFGLGLGLGFELPPTASSSRSPTFRVRSPRILQLRRGIRASSTGRDRGSLSPWDDKPYEDLAGGRRSYLDEQDVVSFLDPPKELIPIDPTSYNPAAYLWKKIGDIPEERRHRLLYMLKSRLISRMWEVAGTRYQDHKLAKQTASALLGLEDNPLTLEFWSCQTSEGPFPVAWINDFKKAIFRGKDGGTYGRIILGGALPASLQYLYGPLYFSVRQVMEVMSTEQPCDLAYEFGDGLLNLQNFPEGFPKPAKHPSPFDDHLVVYLRHAGPGVMVGQAWQEGKDLDQVPKKFCGEILMVKDYSATAYL